MLLLLNPCDRYARSLSFPNLCLAPDLELEADDGIPASGLYYLSELVEEHTVFAKRFLTRLIYSIMVLQLLLCVVDGFPFLLTTLGIFSHVIYLGNMRRFPFVKLSDPLFVTSCGEFKSVLRSLHLRSLPPLAGPIADQHTSVLVLVNHYLWFRHFSHHQQRAYQNMSSYYDAPSGVPTFTEIASYFGLCVWLVPFSLFVSLSASDNVLPTIGSEEPSALAGPSTSRKGQGMAKALVDNVLSAIADISAMSGIKRTEDSRL